MKINYKENKLRGFQKDLDNEIRLLKLFSDYPNSLKFYGCYYTKDEKGNEFENIVLEKCDEDLEKFMRNRRKALDTTEIKEIFIGLNKVFQAMHQEGRDIIHRDLKLPNLLVKYEDNNKNNFIVKLGDYGLGKFLNEDDSISSLKGTSETAAPEIILKKIQKYDNSVDIFSLGVILYQLSNNLTHPFGDSCDTRIMQYFQNYDKDNINILFYNSIKDNDFKDLLKRMLKLNPKNRLSWNEYFEHPFFN